MGTESESNDDESAESEPEQVDDGNGDFFNMLNEVYAEPEHGKNDEMKQNEEEQEEEVNEDDIDWFYVDIDGESKGPITIDGIRRLPLDIFVWNGVTVKDWTEVGKLGDILIDKKQKEKEEKERLRQIEEEK